MTPRVSIVINNFNYERFLAQCIESALAQTLPQTEVIVVDDRSTDRSADIIRSYGDRIVPVLQAENAGQAAAMNAGFAASSGAIVIFLDADDYLYPDAAEKVAAAQRPDVGIIQYRLNLVDAKGNLIDLYPAPEIAFDTGNVVPKLLATGRYRGTVTSGNGFVRETLKAVMPIPAEDFRISADGYLLTAAPFQGSVASIEQPLGAYRMHDANLWSSATQVSRFRRSVLHDLKKYEVLRQRAATAGLTAAPEPGLNDPQHLEMRLSSMCLGAAEHPFPSDTRVSLAIGGARTIFSEPLPLRRRALLALWFLTLGVMPLNLASSVLSWRLEPASRPPFVKRLLRILRRMSG